MVNWYTVPYTLYTGTLYTVHCTLYTIHCILYTLHCRLYTVQYIHCTLCTVHCTTCSSHLINLFPLPASEAFLSQLCAKTIQYAVLYLLFTAQPFQVFRTQTININDEKWVKNCNYHGRKKLWHNFGTELLFPCLNATKLCKEILSSY